MVAVALLPALGGVLSLPLTSGASQWRVPVPSALYPQLGFALALMEWLESGRGCLVCRHCGRALLLFAAVAAGCATDARRCPVLKATVLHKLSRHGDEEQARGTEA